MAQGVVNLLLAQIVVGTTLVFFMRAPFIVSSVVILRISCEILKRIISEMVMGEIEPNLLLLLHKTELHLEDLHSELEDKQTSSMGSLVARARRFARCCHWYDSLL